MVTLMNENSSHHPTKLNYGLKELKAPEELISLRAYYKWLDGSEDALTNWIEAEKEIVQSKN